MIDAYYPHDYNWITTEEMELASGADIISAGSCPNIPEKNKKAIWNQKPLNQQFICIWTYSSPERLRLMAVYYQGSYITFNSNNSIVRNTTGIPSIQFKEHFENSIRAGNIMHVYSNGHSHYDHLVATVTED